MANQHISARLAGIQNILMGAHQAGGAFSNETRGNERQTVIQDFLSAVLPNQYRFGSGDATDTKGNRSGQLDVVIENAFSPSLPIPTSTSRLYLAESIAAVIEVKSNVAAQWTQAVHTAAQLEPITRSFGSNGVFIGPKPEVKVPLFVIGYTGWNQITMLQTKLAENPNIQGILVIDEGLFLSSALYGSITVNKSPWALWGLISSIHQATRIMMSTSYSPIQYAF